MTKWEDLPIEYDWNDPATIKRFYPDGLPSFKTHYPLKFKRYGRRIWFGRFTYRFPFSFGITIDGEALMYGSLKEKFFRRLDKILVITRPSYKQIDTTIKLVKKLIGR